MTASENAFTAATIITIKIYIHKNNNCRDKINEDSKNNIHMYVCTIAKTIITIITSTTK